MGSFFATELPLKTVGENWQIAPKNFNNARKPTN
jgi:hypothetical protein